MTLTPMAFSRVSTRDSDMSSSCEIKDEPEFMPLQGNRAFFGVRAFRGPFRFRQKTQGPCHIATAEEKLLLRFLWKVGSTLQSDRESDLILGRYGAHGAFLELLYGN